jgi:hypothetical protein
VARLRLSYLFGPLSLRPPAMPPSAVLLVREMKDPLPGRITRDFGPAPVVTPEWERAAQDVLGAFYQRAARPMWRPVPSNADAVVFADRAELLACLARDLASGPSLAWWWQSTLRGIPTRLPGSWATVWVEEPRYVPAALAYLEARQQAARVLERIAPIQAWNLLMIVLRAFDLPQLITTPGQAREQRTEGVNAPSDGVRDRELLPWEPHVPRTSTPVELGYERSALLGIGLLLHRAPQEAFTAAFAARFRGWVRAEESRSRVSLSLQEERALPAPGASQRGPERLEVPPNGTSPAQVSNAPRTRMAPRNPLDLLHPGTPALTEKVLPPPTAEIVSSAPARAWEDGEFTRAGGILYLIHLMRRGELLRHFDTGLGGWELIELLGRCLLDDSPELADDAIWAALAQLDGRDAGTPPGSGFEPQPAYIAPAAWLDNIDAQPRFARYRSRGVEIWTEEGFLALDSQGGERPFGGLERLTPARRRKLRRVSRVRPISTSVGPALRRFLHFVLPYARWRMDRALGGLPLKEALLRTGRLYVTATHVDLVMPMNEISVPVRLAGLDANPGWVPELGRVVTFHFVRENY